MMIEQVGASELRHMVEHGEISRIVAVGLPGAWALNVIAEACAEDAMTVASSVRADVPHARYWSRLADVDHFLSEIGIKEYVVDRTQFVDAMPSTARDPQYFPDGPAQFLDHEFVAYVKRFVAQRH
jgi:hypothetical protein